MRSKAWTAAFAFLVLCACGQSAEKADAPAEGAPVVANTSIGPHGAAGISTAIALSVEAAEAAAPGFVVAAGEGQIEGDPYPLITLSLADETVFTLLPNAERTLVHSIVTHSALARGPRGETIGAATFGQAPAAEVLFCREQMMHEDFDFTCSESSEGRFWRSYRLADGYDGARAPFTAIDPDAAVAAGLVEMSWFAPR